jgi:hypothetical protein
MMRVLGIISAEPDSVIEQLLDYDPIPVMVQHLDYEEHPKVRIETSWVFSNLFATKNEISRKIMSCEHLLETILKRFASD